MNGILNICSECGGARTQFCFRSVTESGIDLGGTVTQSACPTCREMEFLGLNAAQLLYPANGALEEIRRAFLDMENLAPQPPSLPVRSSLGKGEPWSARVNWLELAFLGAAVLIGVIVSGLPAVIVDSFCRR